jgi:phosphatidylglycerol:prolipoprotein diacylglycerol transferase
MIEINIDPTMLQLGPITLSWHGVFTAIGLFIGVWITARLAPLIGLSADDVYNAAPWAVLGGVLGARLFHVVDQWSYYSQRPLQILMIQEGGIAIYGAIVGGVIAGYAYGRAKKWPIARFADIAAIGLIFGQGFGRIGDIINGEHHGALFDSPFAVVYTNPNTLGEIGVPVHLAVGYEMVLDLAVFWLLIKAWTKLPPGVIFWTYVVLYSVIRLFIGFFRKDTIVAFGLGQAQLIGVIGIVVGIPLIYLTYQHSKNRPDPLHTVAAAKDAEEAAKEGELVSEPAE